MRIRFARGFWTSRLGLVILGLLGAALFAGAGVFTYYYVIYGRMIEQRLSGHALQTTARIFTVPGRIFVGQTLTANDLAGYLQRAGYTETVTEGAPGRYIVNGNVVEIHPASESYFATRSRTISSRLIRSNFRKRRSRRSRRRLMSTSVPRRRRRNLRSKSRGNERVLRSFCTRTRTHTQRSDTRTRTRLLSRVVARGSVFEYECENVMLKHELQRIGVPLCARR